MQLLYSSMSFNDFLDKYGVVKSQIDIGVKQGRFPTHIKFKIRSNNTRIDHLWFERHRDFVIKVQKFNQKMLHALLQTQSIRHINKLVRLEFPNSKFQTYLNHGINSNAIGSIMNIRLPKDALSFYRYGHWVLRRSNCKTIDEFAGL